MLEAALDGVSLHFERAGQGAPLLLIPGALGTGAGDFSEQIEATAPISPPSWPPPVPNACRSWWCSAASLS
jgi:hypothetical protein